MQINIKKINIIFPVTVEVKLRLQKNAVKIRDYRLKPSFGITKQYSLPLPIAQHRSPHIRPSKIVLDLDSILWIPDSMSVELGFRTPIVSGMLDSLSFVQDSKALDLGFHKQGFPGFRHPDYLTWGEINNSIHFFVLFPSSTEPYRHFAPSESLVDRYQ